MEDFSGKRFQFYSPTKILFGVGALKVAGRELMMAGKKKALLVLDRDLAGSEMAGKLKQILSDRLAGVFDRVCPESGVEQVEAGAEWYRSSQAEGVVSFGGGSCIDTAKAVLAMIAGEAGRLSELMPGRWKQVPGFHLAIPTTAGTGSEVTSMAVVRDAELGVKQLLVDPGLIPKVAILDPELTLSLPARMTAASGADAFTHAVEAILSVSSGPVSDLFAREAIQMIYENLPKAVKDGSNLKARSANLLAASLAGIAFQNALVGIVHALAHSLGGRYGIGHGVAISLCLGAGLEYNLRVSEARIQGIGKLIFSEAKTGKEVIEGIRTWLSGMGLPKKLSEFGVGREDLRACAEQALKDPALLTNPRKPGSADELLVLLDGIY